MISYMKTTVDISDSILMQAKQLAHEQHETLRSLIEEGLTKILQERAARKPQPVQPILFNGNGLSREFKGASWQQISAAAYEGHGG